MPHPALRALRTLGLGALLVLGGGLVPVFAPTALAAPAPVPVLLPAGQTAADWADALAARDLVVSKGLPAAGPSVILLDKRDYWEMTVRGWNGQMQTVNVAPPTNAGEREDLLFYASTLLGKAPETPAPVAAPAPAPVAAGTPAPVAVGTPPPAAGTAAPTPAAGPKPATAGASNAAAPTPATTGAGTASKPATTGVSTPTAAPPTTNGAGSASAASSPATAGASTTTAAPAPTGGTGLWIGAGGGIGLRAEAGAVGDLRVDGGWHLTPSIRVGLGLAGRTEASLAGVAEGGRMQDLDVVAQAAWVAPMRIAPLVGAYGGVASRTFRVGEANIVSAALPILGAEAGVQVPLGPIHLEPSVRVQGDLREILLVSASGTTTLAPLEIRAGLMIGYRAK